LRDTAKATYGVGIPFVPPSRRLRFEALLSFNPASVARWLAHGNHDLQGFEHRLLYLCGSFEDLSQTNNPNDSRRSRQRSETYFKR
jgi:hypothetical protein